jgi:hypothetical protein
MPYIKQERRDMVSWIIDNLNAVFSHVGVTGNLNYILYKLALRNCHNYAEYAAFIGELEAAKLEIYRKQIAPYEECKELENGSIQ